MVSLFDLIESEVDTSDFVKSDIIHLNWFKGYISVEKKDIIANDFGDFEFLEFISWLVKKYTFKMVYTSSNNVRKILRNLHNREHLFKTNPKYWPVPKKPEPDHFEVLDEEQRKRLRTHLIQEIDIIYEKEKQVQKALKSGKSIKVTGSDFVTNPNNTRRKSSSFYKWQESIEDIIYTIHKGSPDFPINMKAEESLKGQKYGTLSSVNYEQMTSPFITIFKRMGVQNLKSSLPFIEKHPEVNFSDVINYLYPSFFETYIIRWAIELETAWSPDIVKNINYKDFLFQPIPTEQKLAFIKSVKEKGQQSESSDLSIEKRMIYPSNSEDKYSAYSLIKLWIKRTSRLRKGINYKATVDSCDFEPFFIYLADWANLKNGINIIVAIHHNAPNDENFPVKTNYQNKHLGFKFDERQLRPTSLYLKEKNQELPILLQVALFGHSDSALTDEHYKNTAHFQQIRKDKLSDELDSIQESIDNGSFKGTLVPLKTEKRIKDKIITIFTDHTNQSPLSACTDNMNPDWAGSENLQLPCRIFNKCLLCSRSSVFEDNIPFVVDRFLYLQQLKKTTRKNSFDSLYLDEFNAAKEVVEYWPYQEQIDQAKDRTFDEGYLLPPIFWEIK
ncbi:MAG: hypothetical protein ACPG5R_03180 [Cognaticolwellia aestuarii]